MLEIGSVGSFAIGGLPLMSLRDNDSSIARQALAERITWSNAFLASFYTALMKHGQGIEMMTATFEDVFSLYSLDIGPAAFGGALGVRQSMMQHGIGGSFALDNHELNVPWSRVIPEALDQMEAVLASNLKGAPTLAALYLESVVSSYRHEYSKATALGWACAERCLNHLWEREVDAQVNRGVDRSARAKRMSDGRTFTASVITEWLYAENVLSDSTYQALTIARKARNDWMHGLEPSSPEEAEALARALASLLPQVGLTISLPRGGYRLIA